MLSLPRDERRRCFIMIRQWRGGMVLRMKQAFCGIRARTIIKPYTITNAWRNWTPDLAQHSHETRPFRQPDGPTITSTKWYGQEFDLIFRTRFSTARTAAPMICCGLRNVLMYAGCVFSLIRTTASALVMPGNRWASITCIGSVSTAATSKGTHDIISYKIAEMTKARISQ